MKNNKGFSLVELIVVIAIMAILAGVAVIGVSVYVPKAQQANDKQLISDIEYALTLAGYNGDFEEGQGGYIILTTEGVSNAADIKENNPELAQVLANAYGDKWDKEMKLAYHEWGNNGLQAGVSAEMAYLVAKSSYLTGSRADQLLSDVEKMTKVVDRLTTGGNGAGITTSITNMFTPEGESCAIDETAAKYGYSRNEGESWEEWANRTGNQTVLSNLLVLTAADESAKVVAGEMTEDEMSEASKLVLEFSSYYAFAAQDPTFSDEFEGFMTELNNVESLGQGNSWFDDLRDAAEANGYNDEYKGQDGNYEFDKLAFTAIMSNVSNSTNAQPDAIKENLSDSSFFTQGIVNDLYNDYITNVEAMQGFYDPAQDSQKRIDLAPGEIAIIFVQKDGETLITSSLPG